MPMTPEAIEHDKSLGCPIIDPKLIYLDHDFNCRDRFVATDCVELAKDIGTRGLLQPITIRPLRPEAKEGVNDEMDLLSQGYLYRVIAGHRRLTSYRILEAEGIPAYVKPAYMSDFDAKDLNAVENLQRKELNFGEEAEAIRHYWIAAWARHDIAKRINKSPGWVQVRMMLLEMPKEIQEIARQGYILPSDMHNLNKYRHNVKQLLENAAILRDARKKGQTQGISRLIKKKKQDFNSKKIRPKEEILELQEVIRKTMERIPENTPVTVRHFVSEQGQSLATKVAAWATGNCSHGEMHRAIRVFMLSLGLEYEMPEFDDARITF